MTILAAVVLYLVGVGAVQGLRLRAGSGDAARPGGRVPVPASDDDDARPHAGVPLAAGQRPRPGAAPRRARTVASVGTAREGGVSMSEQTTTQQVTELGQAPPDPGPRQPALPRRGRHRRRRQAQDLVLASPAASCSSLIIAVLVRPFNLGIEFEGGNAFTRAGERRHARAEVRAAVEEAGAEVASAQTVGGGSDPSYLIKTAELDPTPEAASHGRRRSRPRWPSEFNIPPTRSARARSAGPGAPPVTQQALIGLVVFLVLVMHLPLGLVFRSGRWRSRRSPRWSRTWS